MTKGDGKNPHGVRWVMETRWPGHGIVPRPWVTKGRYTHQEILRWNFSIPVAIFDEEAHGQETRAEQG